MKLGVTYLLTIMRYGYPPKPGDDFIAFKQMRELGFRYLEMEGLGREHARNVKDNLSEYKKALADNEIHIHNFCVVDPKLTSLDYGVQDEALEHFKAMAEVGCELGAETLHLASYTPPVDYVGRAPYKLDGGKYEFVNRTSVHIPEGFSWEKVWESVVRSTRKIAETAAALDKTVLMEPRVGEVICSVDSMIRLIQDVGMPNLKANFDVGHFSAQREDINLALMKLEGQYANIHIADNDPSTADHLPLGEGTIDFEEFFRLLVKQNYQGYLGLDLGGANEEELVRGILKSRDFALELGKKMGIEIEY